jgi:hypothetical protein
MSAGTLESSSVTGQKVSGIYSGVSEIDPNTRQVTYRFLLRLSNSVIIELFPGDVSRCENLPPDFVEAKVQVIEGPPTCVGETIVAIIERDVEGESSAQSPVRQIALVFSSGRSMANMYRGGGGNVLHVESVDWLGKNFGHGWRDHWSGTSVDLDSWVRKRK